MLARLLWDFVLDIQVLNALKSFFMPIVIFFDAIKVRYTHLLLFLFDYKEGTI